MSELINILMGPIPEDLEEIKEYMKGRALYDKALEQFTTKKIEKIVSLEYQAELLGDKMKKVKDYENKVKAKIKEQVAEKHNNDYVFVTINPNPNTDFATFRDKVEKFVKRNMFLDYRYVYEQRGAIDEQAGTGFHAHVLLKRNLDYKPSKIIVNTKNTFKGITDVNNPKILNIQIIGKEFMLDKNEYITGVKTGEGKDEKQAVDKLWREQNNLQAVYGNDFCEI